MFVYVYLYMCVCVYAYMYMCVSVYVCVCACVCARAFHCDYFHVYVYTTYAREDMLAPVSVLPHFCHCVRVHLNACLYMS